MYTLSLILAIISIVLALFSIYYVVKTTSNNSYSGKNFDKENQQIPVLKIDTSDLDEEIKAINSSIEEQISNLKCSKNPCVSSLTNHFTQLITNLSKHPDCKQLKRELFLSIYFTYLERTKYPEEALSRTINDVKAIMVAISKKYRKRILTKEKATKA